MQQDLTDAVNWAVGRGYADRSRVAIMGASYGGYAALAGAAFTPDVYACAIDMFGPSSLITLVENSPEYWKPALAQLHQSVGDPAVDAEFMKSRSPLYSADRIKIPVLIAQGGRDVRVTPQESEQMVAAMKARSLDVQYMYFPDAGHGFNNTEDYLSFFSEVERFLAKHIGGKAE
jgi:dipeptidyl aminopeptidase/acylaminoacyl peptidase